MLLSFAVFLLLLLLGMPVVFAIGIGVGVLLAAVYMLTVALLARSRGYLPEAAPPTAKEVGAALRESFFAVLFPFLLLAALRFGVFVPSEVGAAAVVMPRAPAPAVVAVPIVAETPTTAPTATTT